MKEIPANTTFTPRMAPPGVSLLIMINSPTFHVANARTKHAKRRLAIFFGLLERTIKQRVMFMVNARAAGRARILMAISYFPLDHVKDSLNFRSGQIRRVLLSVVRGRNERRTTILESNSGSRRRRQRISKQEKPPSEGAF